MNRRKKNPTTADIFDSAVRNFATVAAGAFAEAIFTRIRKPAANGPGFQAADCAQLDTEEEARIIAAAETISRMDPEHEQPDAILANPELLTKAHRRAARAVHTDRGGEQSEIADLNAARDRVAKFHAEVLEQ